MKKSAIILAALLITAPMTSQAWCGTPLSNPSVTTCKIKNPKTGEIRQVKCPAPNLLKNILSQKG